MLTNVPANSGLCNTGGSPGKEVWGPRVNVFAKHKITPSTNSLGNTWGEGVDFEVQCFLVLCELDKAPPPEEGTHSAQPPPSSRGEGVQQIQPLKKKVFPLWTCSTESTTRKDLAELWNSDFAISTQGDDSVFYWIRWILECGSGSNLPKSASKKS